MAVAGNGDALVVGIGEIASQVEYSVNASFYSAASGTWSTPVRIDDASVVAVKREVSVVLDETGDAIVTWNQGLWIPGGDVVTPAALMVRHYSAGVWQSVTPVTGYPGEGTSQRRPELVLNASGDAVHVWADTLTASHNDGYRPFARVWDKSEGTWTTPDALGGAMFVEFFGTVQGGIDAAGNAYAAWVEFDGVASMNVFMSSLPAGTQDWPQGVSVESLSDFTRTIELATQPDGTSYLIMATNYDNSGIYVSEVTSELAFTQSTLGTAPGTTFAAPALPQIGIDTTGQAHAAWFADNTVDAALRVGGVWGAAIPLSAPASASRGLVLATGVSGRMYLTFIRGGEMYYSRYD